MGGRFYAFEDIERVTSNYGTEIPMPYQFLWWPDIFVIGLLADWPSG